MAASAGLRHLFGDPWLSTDEQYEAFLSKVAEEAGAFETLFKSHPELANVPLRVQTWVFVCCSHMRLTVNPCEVQVHSQQ